MLRTQSSYMLSKDWAHESSPARAQAAETRTQSMSVLVGCILGNVILVLLPVDVLDGFNFSRSPQRGQYCLQYFPTAQRGNNARKLGQFTLH